MNSNTKKSGSEEADKISHKNVVQNKSSKKISTFTKATILFCFFALTSFFMGGLLSVLSLFLSLNYSIGESLAVPASLLLFLIGPALSIVTLVLGVVVVIKFSLCSKKISLTITISVIFLFVVLIFFFFTIAFQNVSPGLKESPVNLVPVFFFIALPAIGIITNLVTLRSKKITHRFISVGVIFFLVIFLILYVPPALDATLPYIYTPPALRPQNFEAYVNYIQFVKNHNDYRNIELIRWGWMNIDGEQVYLQTSPLLLEEAREYFAEEDIIKLIELLKLLPEINCYKFEKVDNIVIFYTIDTSPFLKSHWQVLFLSPASPFIYPLLSESFLPVPPGVIYSLNGEDPNTIDNEILNVNKPFIKIAGNWYMSRNLTVGPRGETSISIPKPLIDYSLRIDGIDPNELNKFDFLATYKPLE